MILILLDKDLGPVEQNVEEDVRQQMEEARRQDPLPRQEEGGSVIDPRRYFPASEQVGVGADAAGRVGHRPRPILVPVRVFQEPERCGQGHQLAGQKIHLRHAAPLQGADSLPLLPPRRMEHLQGFEEQFPRPAPARRGVLVLVDLKESQSTSIKE